MKRICLTLTLIFLLSAPMVRAGTLRGLVKRSDDSGPVSGAQVLIHGTGFLTTSGSDGNYLISGIPEGVYRLSCHHPTLLGTQKNRLTVESDTEQNFVLGSPEAEHARVEGKSTCDDNPCSGVIIRALRYGSVRALAISGPDGTYVMAGLSEGDYQIHAMAYGFLPASAEDVSVQPPSELDPQVFQRELKLTSAGGFTLHARVGLRDNPMDRSGSVVVCNGQLPVLSDKTDKGGFCTLHGVPAGPLSFTASKAGYYPLTLLDVMVTGDGEIDFALTKQPDEDALRFAVSGSVQLDENAIENDLEGCRIRIWSVDGSTHQTTYTNTEGRYTFDEITPHDGPFQAGAAKEGFISHVVEPFSLDSNKTIDFYLRYDPNHDQGPGPEGKDPGCGCQYEQGQEGIDLVTLVILAYFCLVRIKKWKPTKNTC